MTRNTIPTIENNQIDKSKAVSSPMQSVAPVIMRSLSSATDEKVLFGDSLLDSTAGQRKRRTWSTVFSFIVQCLVIGLLLLLPLWFTEVLPKEQLVTLLVAPPPPPPPPPPEASTPSRPKVVKLASNIANGRLRAPSKIPAKVQMIKDDEVPPPTITGGVVGGVPGGIPGGQLDGVIGGIIGSTSSLAAAPALFKPKPVVPSVQRVRVSPGVVKGLLIHRVEPIYPPVAQQARIQGTVVLTAIIGKDGNVQSLQLVSGHPLLARAAIEAVKQWRYKPFLLNGQPLEVETAVTVDFHLHNQ